MKKQIHELRTRIDGLAGLVRSLDKPVLMISKECIPSDMTAEDILNGHKRTGSIFQVQKEVEIEYESGQSFLSESYKSLLLAKAWLGKVLSELGEESPYKNDGTRKTVEDIEPTADKSLPIELKVQTNPTKPIGAAVRDMTYIEQIDWLREEIHELGKLPYTMFCQNPIVSTSWVGNTALRKAYEYLTEARFYLGFELSRLKEQEG